jgi:predicted nucleotidyltransferase
MEQISYKILVQLQKEETHIREIAKILKTNHMTIQRKVIELQKENVLDYKEVGKSKVFFIKNSLEAKEYLKLTEHNKLLQIIKKHPRLRKIIEKIQELNIDLAILFGSYAKNKETNTSDIDIYINTNDKKIKETLQSLDSKISVKFGDFDEKNLLIQEIVKNHIILKGVDRYYEFIH